MVKKCKYVKYKPLPPFVVTQINIAPEDVEHAVGRPREAHHITRGGACARRGQRSPGVVRRAEAEQVVASCTYPLLSICNAHS
jgi:hypothetical protein